MESVDGNHLSCLKVLRLQCVLEWPTVLGCQGNRRTGTHLETRRLSIAHRLRCQALFLLSNSPSPQGILSRGVFVGMSSPLSPACSQEGDLTGQKNLVPWEYELLASAPGPSNGAPSLLRLVIPPPQARGSGDQDMIGQAHGARRRLLLLD